MGHRHGIPHAPPEGIDPEDFEFGTLEADELFDRQMAELEEMQEEAGGEEEFERQVDGGWLMEKHEREERERRPTRLDVERANAESLHQYEAFRKAAPIVAKALSAFEEVAEVIHIGSTAQPLATEVAPHGNLRAYRLRVLHRCKDLDIVVRADRFDRVSAMRTAVKKALMIDGKPLVQIAEIEFFLFPTGSNEYAGKICHYKKCPEATRSACFVPGCGDIDHVRQISGFKLRPESMAPDRSTVLYKRA